MITKFNLFSAFANGQAITLDGIPFKNISAIEREDGSGRSFNITGYIGNSRTGELYIKKTIHIRTID